jgi:hypothetical protein
MGQFRSEAPKSGWLLTAQEEVNEGTFNGELSAYQSQPFPTWLESPTIYLLGMEPMQNP